MAQITHLLLKNAAGTDVTFAPQLVDAGSLAIWRNRVGDQPLLMPQARVTFNESATVRHVSGKVTLPVLDSVTGVTDTAVGSFKLSVPLKLAQEPRENLVAFLADLLADSVVSAANNQGEMPF